MYVNEKTRPVETILRLRGGEIKENGGGVNFYKIHYIVRMLVKITIYPQYNNNMIIKKNCQK
jgi:hypothetical protein